MFVRMCLLSALAIGALAGPAVSGDRAAVTWNEGRDGQPMQVQLKRFFTPKIRMPRSSCRRFGQC